MVELTENSYGWEARFDGYWEAGQTAWDAYRKLTMQPAVNIQGLNINVQPRNAQSEVVSAQDAWALNEKY